MKRIFDILCVLVLSVFWLPLMFAIFVLTFLLHGWPVFFRQERGGLNNSVFKLYKFRSMTNEKDEQGNLLPDEKRLTRFGSFLRRSSLDELPSLINVLKGDMSLVGPRPFLSEYLALYSREQLRRHEVRPGITGWAQVNGRNVISWQDKFKLDVWYVDNRTFWLDLKILVITLRKVVKRDGISAEGHATAEKFRGND